MKRISIVFGCLAAIILVLILGMNKSKSFKILYVKLFKKSVSVVQKDKNGNFDGEALYFKEGKLFQKGNFKTGSREGSMTRYYPDGKIEDKVSYKDGKEDGHEYGYYESGNLKYTCCWKAGKRFGSLIYNYENGNPELFHAYDIFGEKFNILHFDQKGNVSKYLGFAVSNKIYSLNSLKDSLVVLKDKNTYHGIRDLFLSVSTPPTVTTSIVITVNDVQKTNLSVKNYTIQILNAFNKVGNYKIVIAEQVMDKKGKILEISTFKTEIKKA